VAPHFYTDDREIDDAVAAMASILETGAWQPFAERRALVT